jgi:hypothetical protein
VKLQFTIVDATARDNEMIARVTAFRDCGRARHVGMLSENDHAGHRIS